MNGVHVPALTEDQARELLASCIPHDQTWGAHSVAVARSAGRIAEPKVRALMAEIEGVTGQPTEQLCGATRL